MITLCSGHFLNKLTWNWVVKTDSIVVQIELGTVLKQLFIFVLSCHYTRLVEGISLFPSVRFTQLHWTLSEVFCSISGHFSSFLVPLNLSVQLLKIRVTGVDTLHLRLYVLYGLSAWMAQEFLFLWLSALEINSMLRPIISYVYRIWTQYRESKSSQLQTKMSLK